MPPRRLGDRGRRHLRLGLAVARRCRARRPSFAGSRAAAAPTSAPSMRRVSSWYSRACSSQASSCPARPRRLAEIHDAAGAKAGLGLDRLVHALPEAQALDDQRDLARVARHLAAPAPIAARLLAGDVALLAQHASRRPCCARNSAVLVPMMPPPMMTTSAWAGRVSSDGTGSTRGAMFTSVKVQAARGSREAGWTRSE